MYLATDEGAIREHAAKAGIPANAIHEARAAVQPPCLCFLHVCATAGWVM